LLKTGEIKMKKMFICFAILGFAICAKANTYRLWTNQDWEWSSVAHHAWTPVVSLWTPSSIWNPTPWAKIAIDGAQWINPSIPTISQFVFRKSFYKYATNNDFRISRATIWMTSDTSDPLEYFDVLVVGPSGTIWQCPTLTRGDTLHRLTQGIWGTGDLTEALDAQPAGTYWLWVYTKAFDFTIGTIAYMSIDYDSPKIDPISVVAG
jgi:hypothetical protein